MAIKYWKKVYVTFIIFKNIIESTDWFIGTDLLPNSEFPIIFHSVKGNCESNRGDSSKFNLVEQTVVLSYIEKLLNGKWNGREVGLEQIGVVSPYSKQCSMIKNKCDERGYDRITVATAEIFQGQERHVMIVSTVRCGGNEMGFVANALVIHR